MILGKWVSYQRMSPPSPDMTKLAASQITTQNFLPQFWQTLGVPGTDLGVYISCILCILYTHPDRAQKQLQARL